MSTLSPAVLLSIVIGCLVVVVIAGLYWSERSKTLPIDPKRKSSEY